MAILSCHVSIKLPPKISDGQIFLLPVLKMARPGCQVTSRPPIFTVSFSSPIPSYVDGVLSVAGSWTALPPARVGKVQVVRSTARLIRLVRVEACAPSGGRRCRKNHTSRPRRVNSVSCRQVIEGKGGCESRKQGTVERVSFANQLVV